MLYATDCFGILARLDQVDHIGQTILRSSRPSWLLASNRHEVLTLRELLAMVLQEIDQVGSAGIVVRMIENIRAFARTSERHGVDLTDLRFGTIGHENDAVGEVE